ncbi:hypothetical protein GCM10022260_18010 [Gaetbulibacter aestuarii]
MFLQKKGFQIIGEAFDIKKINPTIPFVNIYKFTKYNKKSLVINKAFLERLTQNNYNV